MQLTEVSVLGVRSAVVRLRRPRTRLRFVLFPMVHFGRPEFYAQVAERLAGCHLIVAEGADAASSTGLAYAIALRITGQSAGRALVHQDIDFRALGVPTLWPDGPVYRRVRWWRMPLPEWLGVAFLVPLLVVTMAVGGRNWLLRQRLEISDDTQVRFFLRFLHNALIRERDAELLATLCEIHTARSAEPIDVAVVYGAAHLPAVVQGLNARFGYRATSGDWLTVIDF